MKKLILIPILLSGCASVVPDSIKTEYEHRSHLSQHRPFTNQPHSDQLNTVAIVAHWNVEEHGYVELGEALCVDSLNDHGKACGSFYGSREEFIGRVGYEWKLK